MGAGRLCGEVRRPYLLQPPVGGSGALEWPVSSENRQRREREGGKKEETEEEEEAEAEKKKARRNRARETEEVHWMTEREYKEQNQSTEAERN